MSSSTSNMGNIKHYTKGKYKIVITIVAVCLFGMIMPMIFKFFDIDMSKYGIYLYWCITIGFFYLIPDKNEVIVI